MFSRYDIVSIYNKFMMLRIAVDFDGTIVENRYPQIGKPILFAFETLKMLNKKGHLLILWTCREGDLLQQAVDFCNENGVEFYAINSNYPEEKLESAVSRKVDANIYIDDRNIGGFVGWTNVWNSIHPEDEMVEQPKNIFKWRLNSKRIKR